MRGSMHVGGRRRTAAEKPVFVDRTGARRRWFTTVAVGGAAVLCLALVGLVAVLTGIGPGVLPALPGGGGQVDPKGAVEHTPVPTPSTVDQLPVPGVTGQQGPAATGAATPSPTVSGHRTRPTQTPAHPTPSKKK